MPATNNYTIYQGDRFKRNFVLKSKNLTTGVVTPMDLTGQTISGQVKRNVNSTDAIPFDITITDVPNGAFTVFLASPTTDNMTPGEYIYSVDVEEDPDNIYKLLIGKITIKDYD